MDELFDLYDEQNILRNKLEAYDLGQIQLTDAEQDEIYERLSEIDDKIIYLQDEEDFGEGW